MYLPRNEVYRGGREIMVRTPIANIRTTSKVLNYARVGGKVLGVAGVAAGIGVADYVWGDQFFNYIETKMK